MFGLDISDRMLRLVSLTKKKKEFYVESVNELAVSPGVINEGEIIKPEQLRDSIIKLVQSAKPHKPRSKKVVACLPERKSFLKILHFEKEKEINEEVIKTELVNHIPEELTEMYIDWQKMDEDEETQIVLVGVVPKQIVESYQDVITSAGLRPGILEIESIAISRAITPDPLDIKGGVLIIDIGLDRTSFIILDHASIQFTSADDEISGNLMTSTIMKELSVSYKEAEKAKRLGGLSKTVGKGEIAKILKAQIDILVSKTKQVIEFYKGHYGKDNKITNIILTGGGSNLIDLESVLVKKLKLKNVRKGDSLLNISKTNSSLLAPKTQSSYATAIGLALRAMNHDNT